MRFELERGQPEFIVFLGQRARDLTSHLAARGLIPRLPPYECIHHYTYVMDRPSGKVPGGDPERVAAWKEQIGDVAERTRVLAIISGRNDDGPRIDNARAHALEDRMPSSKFVTDGAVAPT